jgi:hypothetical protein
VLGEMLLLLFHTELMEINELVFLISKFIFSVLSKNTTFLQGLKNSTLVGTLGKKRTIR